MDIDLEVLEAAFTRLITNLRKSGVDSVNTERDFYWVADQDCRYSPYDDPKKFTLGQLSDDYTEVSKIAAGEADPLPCGLVWLGELLRTVGEETV